MEYAKAVGLAVRSERVAAELTQERLAEVAGIPERTLSRIESGDPHVELRQLVSLAEAMALTDLDLIARAHQILGRRPQADIAQANSGGVNVQGSGNLQIADVDGDVTVIAEGRS